MEETPVAAREWRRAGFWFLATFACVTGVYAYQNQADLRSPLDPLWFALSFLSILAVHEAGHYVVARLHGFELSPPLFIPLPTGFGTLGAVIRLRSLPNSRQALLEMGAAGPLAGALLAFCIAAVSVPWMRAGAPLPPGTEIAVFNDPLILRLLGLWRMGHVPGRYDSYHPATFGAWAGCLLTAVNLIPVGQFDGGHVLNAIHPRSARVRTFVVLAVMIVLGWWSHSWWVWAGFVALLGAWRPLPVPESPPLPLRAWLVAAAVAVVFGLTFMPIPIEIETTPGAAATGALEVVSPPSAEASPIPALVGPAER